MTETRTRAPSAVVEAPPSERAPAGTRTLALVVQRELRARGLSRSFLVSTLVTVGLLVGIIVVPTLLGGGPTTHEVGVVGEGNTEILVAAERLAGATAVDDEPAAIEVTAYPDPATAATAVEDGEVDAVLVDGAELLVARAGGFGSSALTDLLQQAAGAEQIADVVGAADAERLDAALSGEALVVTTVSGQDAAQTDGRTWLAYGGVMLMYILVVSYGQWTLYGVTEEKANRVIEILLSTAPPWHLFAGKVLGIAVLGLAQFAVLAVAALTAIRVTGAFELPVLPVGFAGVLALWLLIGFAIYLVLFGCAGALAAKMEDAQSAMSPILTILLIGFFASFVVLPNPDGTVALVGTFVPFLAPFIVPIRAALETLPMWQHVAAVGISLAAAGGLVAFAGRVYRGGALQFAGKVGWRQALRHRG